MKHPRTCLTVKALLSRVKNPVGRPRQYPRKDINTGKVKKKVCVGKSYPRKKPCRICGVTKHISSFYYLKKIKCFHSYCKSCQSNYMADRYSFING
jgi:hypothetical protein